MSDLFKPDTLMMFSGGLDSTAALWKLVQEKRKLHVHHMNLRNVERRALAEHKAVVRIMEYVKATGIPFVYSESTHEYACFNNQFVWDSDIVSFVAGTMCLAMPWIKEVALGMTASDTNTSLTARVPRANLILEAFGTGAKKVYPVKGQTKQELYDMLPADLRALTWSCRKPVYKEGEPFPCNHCQTCKHIQQLTK
jgi:7-cyano-7-deazaguanine synthase in queuosine biosynthesis